MKEIKRRISVRLNDSEYKRLIHAVERSGLSQQNFLSHLIAGYHPKERPPPEYFAMMNELRRVGDLLAKIAEDVHSYGVLDPEEYNANVALYREVLRKITHAVIGPDKGGN